MGMTAGRPSGAGSSATGAGAVQALSGRCRPLHVPVGDARRQLYRPARRRLHPLTRRPGAAAAAAPCRPLLEAVHSCRRPVRA